MTPVARIEVTSDVLVFDKKRSIDVKFGGEEDWWTMSFEDGRYYYGRHPWCIVPLHVFSVTVLACPIRLRRSAYPLS